MRKYRKFDEGGDITAKRVRLPDLDPLEEANKGENLDTTPGPKARRDSEEVMDETGTSSRFRRNLETGDLYSEEPITRAAARAMPRAAAKPTPAVAKPTPAASSADIPKAAAAAPASTGEDTSGPSNLDRILMGIPVAGAGIAGVAKLAQMRKAKQAADAVEAAKAAASRFASPQARQVTAETGRRFGPKAEMEAAESTMRGAVGRRDIQAKRAETAKGRAKAMEENKPVLQATPKKASPRSRTRDEDVDYELRAKGGRIGYAKGGSVRGGGCEVRGKTRGVMR